MLVCPFPDNAILVWKPETPAVSAVFSTGETRDDLDIHPISGHAPGKFPISRRALVGFTLSSFVRVSNNRTARLTAIHDTRDMPTGSCRYVRCGRSVLQKSHVRCVGIFVSTRYCAGEFSFEKPFRYHSITKCYFLARSKLRTSRTTTEAYKLYQFRKPNSLPPGSLCL